VSFRFNENGPNTCYPVLPGVALVVGNAGGGMVFPVAEAKKGLREFFRS